jgi:hypothetical protein
MTKVRISTAAKVQPKTGSFAVIRTLVRAKGSSAPSPARRLSLAGLLSLCVLLSAAASAQAKDVHVLTSSFGGKGSGPGQLSAPAGMAVNDSTSLVEPGAGDVYVVDQGNNRVERFSGEGMYLGQFNGSGAYEAIEGATTKHEMGIAAPAGAFSDPKWVAVDNSCALHQPLPLTELTIPTCKESDPSNGDVYVTDNGHKAIDKFSETGAYLGQITKAVCPPPNPEPGGVLAQRESEEQEKACPPGEEVGFREFEGVAVDTVGELWVEQSTDGIDNYSNEAPENKFRASRWIPGQSPSIPRSPGFAIGPEDDEQGLIVNQPEGNRTGIAFNFGTEEVDLDYVNLVSVVAASQQGTVLESFGAEQLSASAGIAVNSSTETGNALDNAVYVSDGASDRVDAYSYIGIPSVVSQPASNVEVGQEAGHAEVQVTLNGTVDPNGLPVTGCELEYGTSTSYGHIAPCEPEAKDLGAGEAPEAVTAKIKNLLPDTTYHFRARAANLNDENDPSVQNTGAGGDETFLTPGPSVVSEAPAAGTTATETTLSGVVDPEGFPLSKCEFEYIEAAQYQPAYPYEGASTVPCEQTPAEIGSATNPVPVSAKLTGLRGGTSYRVRLALSTEVFSTKETASVAGPGQEVLTLPVPVVAGAKAEHLTASTVELQATVNPEGLQVTHCEFEYATSEEYAASGTYGQLARCEQKKSAIGAGTEPVPVSATLTELQPNTEYHWRLAVTNKNGSSLQGPAGSADHMFVYGTTGVELPDHRSYELVTPQFKNGALVGDVFVGTGPDIAESGSRVIVRSIQCFAESESCVATRGTFGEPFEFDRTSSGWTTTPLAPPAIQFSENSAWLYNANEGAGLFSMPTGPQGEDEWYKREAGGAFQAIGPATAPGVNGVIWLESQVKEATANLSHVVWDKNNGTPEVRPNWPGDDTPVVQGYGSLYEYAGTGSREPFLIGVTNRGAPPWTAGAKYVNEGAEQVSTCGTGLGNGEESTRDALSADGRTVYFTANEKEIRGCFGSGVNAHTEVPVSELYARVDGEAPDAHTLAISEPQALEPGLREGCESTECIEDTSVASKTKDWRHARFEGASEDGSKAFFTSEQQLTDHATEGPGGHYRCGEAGSGCNLYLYDLDSPKDEQLVDVSGSGSGVSVPDGPRVQGVVAISADGSHVYFVALGKLADNRSALGKEAVEGHDNLYVYERDARYPAGHTAFIATLSGSDNYNWTRPYLSANVTPEGRFLVFGSHGDLTPDDTRTGGGQQIFRYDAASEQLTRISIGDDGFNDDGNAGTGEATIVQAVAGAERAGPPRGDPTMSNDGSYIFFESPVGLTAHALNDVPTASKALAENVYEYHDGHVYLISDGRDVSDTSTPCGETIEAAGEAAPNSAVCLLGADATGHNVFFMTADQLVTKDNDTQADIYDARVCEPENGNPCISEPPPALPPCLGEQCHGIPAATPSLLAPGSASFNGEGNVGTKSLVPASKPKPKSAAQVRAEKLAKALKACHKKKGKERAQCEKQAKAKYGSKVRAKKTNRRAN